MGQPVKMQQNIEADPSSPQPSVLNPHLQVASGVQISISPEDESVLAAIPTNNLISELMELHSLSLLVSRALQEELERTTTVVVAKLKTELAESASSLKITLETMGPLKKKCAKSALKPRRKKRR